MKQEYESFMQITPCKTCKGQRLKKESLAVTVGEKNIAEVTDLSVRKLQNWLDDLMLTEQQELIGHQILKEIKARIRSWQMWAWIISPFPEPPALFPEEKPRESAWPPRLVLVWWA